MSFLPDDYEVPESSGGKFFSPSKITSGTSIDFRILSDAITGYEYWTTDDKPVTLRKAPQGTPADIRYDDKGQPERIKHLWAFVAYNYSSNSVRLWKITQGTIQQPILNLFRNPKWGSPSQYDLTLTKKGSGLQTEYSVTPSPKEPLPQELQWAIAEAQQINLQALYDNGDPFANVGQAPQQTYSQPTDVQPAAKIYDFSELIAASDVEMKRLGWTTDYARQFLMENYNARSRQVLSDKDLIGFVDYLKAQPTPALEF